MKEEEVNVNDWVMVTRRDLVPLDVDSSIYDGLPCVVKEIKDNGRVILYSPCKICFGRPPLDEAPLCQIVKIDGESGKRFVDSIMKEDTYSRTRR